MLPPREVTTKFGALHLLDPATSFVLCLCFVFCQQSCALLLLSQPKIIQLCCSTTSGPKRRIYEKGKIRPILLQSRPGLLKWLLNTIILRCHPPFPLATILLRLAYTHSTSTLPYHDSSYSTPLPKLHYFILPPLATCGIENSFSLLISTFSIPCCSYQLGGCPGRDRHCLTSFSLLFHLMLMASRNDSPKSPPQGASKVETMAEATRLSLLQVARLWYCFKIWIRITWVDLLSLMIALVTYIVCERLLPIWPLFERHIPMVYNQMSDDWEGPVWLDHPKAIPGAARAFGWAFQEAVLRYTVYTLPILVMAVMQFQVRDVWDFTAACLGLAKAWLTASIVEVFLQRFLGKSLSSY